ncbi:hypothetical protein EDC04DRAFT_3092218 [Pisolithus marmoratus]|nr:hypothetical protein EDC04DRAFT_3092218 [Pisolithus marmoratus]
MGTHTELIHLSELQYGDIFYANVIIDPKDNVVEDSTSHTARCIRTWQPIRRRCIVLKTGSTRVHVTYLATFRFETKLPPDLDKDMWYPFQPAEQEGSYVPLEPHENGVIQWASLRTEQIVTQTPVERRPWRLPAASVDAIRRAMWTVQ